MDYQVGRVLGEYCAGSAVSRQHEAKNQDSPGSAEVSALLNQCRL
jgi:hypothetical protein